MKITSVDVMELKPRKDKHWRPVVCRVNTDEGLYGYGEAAMAYGVGASAAFGMIKDLSGNIIGMDPLENEIIWEKLYKATFWGQNGGPVVFSGISAIDIAGKFITNASVGKLFVITGNAKNGYSEPRGLIKISGKLYSKGKKLEKTETVFCGNTLTDPELTTLDIAAIKTRLSNRAGDNKANLNVAPGRVVPFMLVFSGLPDNLEEYTIEVIESFPSAKK